MKISLDSPALFLLPLPELLLLHSLNVEINVKLHILLAYQHFVCSRLLLPNRTIHLLCVCVFLSIFLQHDIKYSSYTIDLLIYPYKTK